MRESNWTLNLLARDVELANMVVRLDLDQVTDTSTCQEEATLINLGAFANLGSLRHIRLRGIVFHHAAQQSEFGRVLRETCSRLERLDWIDLSLKGDICRWPVDHAGDLPGLKQVEWRASIKGKPLRPARRRPMTNILVGSQDTIQTLSLPLFAFNDDVYPLWKGICFRNLRSISFTRSGTVYDDFLGMCATEKFVQFIVSHGIIEDLDLDGLFIYQTLTEKCPTIGVNWFPRLRSFRGRASTFKELAEAHLESLTTTLVRLHLLCQHESTDTLRHIFGAILQSVKCESRNLAADATRQPVLKEIEMEFNYTMTPSSFGSIMRQCVDCYGESLLVWRGTLPRMAMDDLLPAELADLFEPFKKLEVVDLTIPGLRKIVDHHAYRCLCTRYEQTIANRCRMLREIRVS